MNFKKFWIKKYNFYYSLWKNHALFLAGRFSERIERFLSELAHYIDDKYGEGE